MIRTFCISKAVIPCALVALLCSSGAMAASSLSYPIVDTAQSKCFNATVATTCPTAGAAFYGQNAQQTGTAASYTDNGDGTVTDNITGLMWQKTPDTNGDGKFDVKDKLSYDEAVKRVSTFKLAGHTDWRVPTIKELYSLMNFSGIDPSGKDAVTSDMKPFINTKYFTFAYGDTSSRERIIDAQYVTTALYVDHAVDDGGGTLFGVNFADGRIKGYGLKLHGNDKTFTVMYVRGGKNYGVNDFKNNDNGTITDAATGLMWSKDDSKSAMNWGNALAWAQQQNAAKYLGHDDWRLPNAKELQSIVDYSRSPSTTNSPAIDPLFNSTAIVNEAGKADYPMYWTSTTHENMSSTPGNAGAYIAFGRAMGYQNKAWGDAHGAGAQRSDPKSGSASAYPTGNGPQGDAIRVDNYVRLVRDAK